MTQIPDQNPKRLPNKKDRLKDLEEKLIAGIRSPKFELCMDEVRRKGLITVLRERTRSTGDR